MVAATFVPGWHDGSRFNSYEKGERNMMMSNPSVRYLKCAFMALLIAGFASLGGMGESRAAPPTEGAACNATLKDRFKPNDETRVTLVKAFKKGESLTLDGSSSDQKALSDLCLVKVLVGPGNPGPAGAPSTSPGIGIEVWLPQAKQWTGRLHTIGCGGYCGVPEISSLTKIGGVSPYQPAARAAGFEGSVSAISDAGHTVADLNSYMSAGWATLPDGRINRPLWNDYVIRGIHETAATAKALAKLFYGRAPRYAYFTGNSGGGREGLALAQRYPHDFDGIVSENPAIYFTRFLPANLYPALVMQRELKDRGHAPLSLAQFNGVSAAAISACDTTVTGQHDGYISDPAACRYNPATDPALLCAADGGRGTAPLCITRAQGEAVNKIWYGLTIDGTAPDPAINNGFADELSPGQLWFGFPRGTAIGTLVTKQDEPHGLFDLSASQTGIQLGDSTLTQREVRDMSGRVTGGWQALTYADLARAQAEGARMQPDLADVDTVNPDLSAFKKSGGKLVVWIGLSDFAIPPSGAMHYNARVLSKMGGLAGSRPFYRFFAVPGMGHGTFNGSDNGVAGVSPPADPPLPSDDQMFQAMVAWVEKGVAPDQLVMVNSKASARRLLCAFPAKLVYHGGDVGAAESYACR